MLTQLDTTYTRNTAIDICKNMLNKPFTPKEVEAQLQNPHSIYRTVISLSAMMLKNQFYLRECENSANELQGILFQLNIARETIEKNKEGKKEISSAEQTLIDNMKDIRHRHDVLRATTEELQKEELQLRNEVRDMAQQELMKWLELQTDNADKIIQMLEESGVKLPEDFKQELVAYLDKQQNDLNQEDFKRLKLRKLNDLEQVVISVLIKSVKEPINA